MRGGKESKPSGSVAALPEVVSVAAQDLVTAGAENAAVVLCNSSTAHTPGSNLKAVLITLLSWLLAWRPSLAIRLGKLVLRFWRNFWGA